MCKIIKNVDKLISELNSYEYIICIPIYSDMHMHSLNPNNKLSLLYFRYDENSCIIPFNHSECENVPYNPDMFGALKTNILTINKKNLLSIINSNNIIDSNLIHYYIYNKSINTNNIKINAIEIFKRRYHNLNHINDIIPIYKHLEWCMEMGDIILNLFTMFKKYDIDIIKSFYKFNRDVIPALYFIELNGIQVSDKIEEIFDSRVNRHICDEKIYHSYNIYTTTSRPSNSFGGINFAALKKGNDERSIFIPRNDMLVEYDYDAYHLRLIGDLVGYEFGNEYVHEHLSKIYDVGYDESKAITFKLLYGGIDEDISDNIEYFNKIKIFIDSLWNDFKSKKEIKTYIYNRPIYYNNFNGMDKNKLFNYYIQSFETEYNIGKIIEIQKFLSNYNSSLVSYNYDAFLIDFDVNDGRELIKNIKLILESDKYLTKVSAGKNYKDLYDISDKI